MTPESAEDFHRRILAATDEEGRLPVGVEEMPGWLIFPFELASLQVKPIDPLLDEEMTRHGEDPATCWCASADEPADVVWSNERWTLKPVAPAQLPVMLILQPRAHHDLHDVPAAARAEMADLMVAVVNAVEALPSVGRCHVSRIGDGGAHLHWWFMGRPARTGQFRGSPLLDWAENFPVLPDDVAAANNAFVAERLVASVGGIARH